MNIQIRDATPEDYHPLCKLFDQVDALHRENLPHLFQKPSGKVREDDYYMGLISDEEVGLFVAEGEQNILGFVHVLIRDMPDIPVFTPRRCALIVDINVRPEFQNHGIGRNLMQKAQDWAAVKGASAVELNVYDFNQPAIAFYRRLGYKTISRKMSRSIKNE